MKTMVIAVLALGTALAVSAAENPAPAVPVAATEQAATSNRTVKVHCGCRPKRTGKRGGGANIRHRCRTKQVQETAKP